MSRGEAVARLLRDAGRGQRRATGVAIVLAVAAAVAGVGLLAVSGWFLTGAAVAGAGGVAAVRAFNYLTPSAGIRAFAIVRTLGRYGERLFSHRAALFALAQVRPALFSRLAAAEPAEALARPSGEVAAQLGADVDALEDAVVRRVTWPGALAAAAAGMLASALAGPWSAVVLLAGLMAMRAAGRLLAGRALAAQVRRRADALTRLKSAYADYAAAGVEIAVYGLTHRIAGALAEDVAELEAARLDVVRQEALAQGAQALVGALTVAGVLATAQGGAALAAAAALAGAATAEAWGGLARTDLQRPRVDDGLARLEGLASLPARAGAEAAAAVPPLCVGESVLRPGDRLLITGPSGAGKTRLLGTLLGLRTDAPERLLVGDAEARDLGLEHLRRLFASAPQDAALIAGTVADNLRLARPGVTEAEMWAALEVACLAATVRALPQGLDQWLGGDGARLSGGQRKRLALARALLAGRPWLVLDEPSEGLDAETERQLTDNLAAWLERTGSGLLLVSHRTEPHRLVGRRLAIGGQAHPE